MSPRPNRHELPSDCKTRHIARQNNGRAGITVVTPVPQAKVPTVDGKTTKVAAAMEAPAQIPGRSPRTSELKVAASIPTLAAEANSIAAFKSCERAGDQSTIACASQMKGAETGRVATKLRISWKASALPTKGCNRTIQSSA